MAETIAATCMGCGHIVRVPSSFGGRKAKCPKCAGIIVIPSAGETHPGDFLSDAQLPEVAREGDPFFDEDSPTEEGPAVAKVSAPRPSVKATTPPPAAPAPRETTVKRKTGKRGRGQTRVLGGRGGREGSSIRHGARPAKKSSAGLIVGICGFAVAVLIVVVAVAMKGSGGAHPKKSGAASIGVPPPVVESNSEEDSVLEGRTRDFLRTFNSGNIPSIAAFYSFDPSQERAVRNAVSKLLESGARHQNYTIKSARAADGTVTVVSDYVTSTGTQSGREMTINWKKVDGTWLIADAP
jgi:hypothetical protein